MTELTILMPCLNEAETLAVCINKAQAYLARAGIKGEVLIADNGSTDGSQAIATGLGARVVAAPQKGYGSALIAGIDAAKGRFIIMGDSDDSYDFSRLENFVEKLRAGADLVMGNRFKGGIAKNAMPALHRYLGNPVLSTIGRIFYRTPVGDFHCGLRGFSRDAILRLQLATPGMEFASEMVIRASLAGLRIEEVPTTLAPDGRSRPPHLRSWRDGWRHLKLLLTFAPYWLFLYPGLLLLGLGTIAFGRLMFGPVQIGGITFDIASLILASALILTGFQMSCFYVLARIFSVRFKLLPSSARFERLNPLCTIDNACIIGGILIVAAVTTVIAAVVYWAGSDFGALDPGTIARPAALAVICASLGTQSITTGFLAGLLNQRLRDEGKASTKSIFTPQQLPG
ncbi:glycosyltransferase family 2 protein [Pseudorhodobacter sp.]|uniref:glycosyltransferase family 2 protein n=1 Tax=Pseudorhodobacter sp. TaxID=1934400 RepID=UPI0026470DFA|nr:glycosyltransferase family 2 protein [Pseudorhodobacter sp.]MDN5785615.1 glycosyltransferase family 2 protein [Pseudorhodobacter sp.]